jgi:glucan phosphoethanolaminetransferase (alkaline phosphatase superfamily)
MANWGIWHFDQQHPVPDLGWQEANHLESSVRHCAFFFLFSGASIMMLAVGDSLVNREHIFVGFLLFLLGSIMWLLQAFLLRRFLKAIMVAGLVVAAFRKMFIARD